MKKLMKKKNNKGFSLVELIVVVLILGIIAVALAPQVMKWVGRARENSDENTAKDIKSSVQIALADYTYQHGNLTETTTFDLGKDVTKITCSPANTNLDTVLNEVITEIPKPSDSSKKFTVTITVDATTKGTSVSVTGYK